MNLRRECTFWVVDGFQGEVTETLREIASGFASRGVLKEHEKVK